MKNTTLSFAIIIFLSLFSCRQVNKETTIPISQIDSTKIQPDSNKQQELLVHKQYEEKDISNAQNDSIAIINAIKIAEQTKVYGRFTKTYTETMPDSSYQILISITKDHYFSDQRMQLKIKRTTPTDVYIDFFSTSNGKTEKVLSHKRWIMEYIGDTVGDINGDGLKDFVVNWYGTTGCCLKAFSNVYLQKENEKYFSSSYEFENPTFSPKEKMIRGVCYGQAGNTPMYKFRWNKESIDTVEYVYYEENKIGEKTGKLIVSNNLPNSINHKVLKRIDHVPPEYKKIYGYDWFTNNLK